MQSIKAKIQNNKYIYWSSLVAIVGVFLVVTYFVSKLFLGFGTTPTDVLVTTPESCELEFTVGHTPDMPDAEIAKIFRTTEGADLGDTPLNPLQKFVSEVSVKNTGNTTLEGLTVVDYLNDTFIEHGAQNMNLVRFVEFKVNPQDFCTYNDGEKLVKCSPFSLLPNDTFTFSFVLEVTEDLGVSKTIKNVTRLTNIDNSIIRYADDVTVTQVVSSICNFGSGLCEQVLRDKTDTETSCSIDDDCVVETPKHFQCVDQSCKLVDGEGVDSCDNDRDCSYSTCEEERCVEKDCSTGNCTSSCSDNDDCREPTRFICRDQSCVEVNGEGSDVCDSDNDCVYFTCDDSDKCVSETCENGDCTSSCDSDGDCKDENYRICRDERCVEVSGRGSDECNADIDCEEVTYTSQTPQQPVSPVVAQTVPETGTETILERMYLALVGFAVLYAGFLISKKYRKYD